MTDPVFSRAASRAKEATESVGIAIVYVGRTGTVHYVVHADDAELAAQLEELVEGTAGEVRWGVDP